MDERDLFLAAHQIDDPEQRKRYLDEVCQDEGTLRHRVEELLSLADQAGSFLEVSDSELASTFTDPLSDSSGPVPSSIGPYKLLEPIGEGGMGTVYMAEQTVPVRRRVALKVIKAGMDSRQVLARFDAERQALAMMDHPNIAKVLDAGATEAGRPYFVMELVKGLPITRYCDTCRFNPRERLQLFIPVCQAVQHAHQKGIIHRDLKPSNVLVGLYDGRPVPKVIDFGVAKATGPKLTEATLFTGFGTVVGTAEYMSPEQALLDNLDIDTRSDVYSLGVLLYELLTGSTPLQRKRIDKVAMLEILRLIREEEPPRPSTRLSITEELPSIAACRNLEPSRLRSQIRGELDWIVMKALEKDRSRRYETANGLAADLQHHLDGDPVAACPPSAGYRIKKFAMKHRRPLAVAATLSVLMLMMAVGAVIWGLQAESQRRRIDQANASLEQTNQNLRIATDRERDARRDSQERLREALLASARAGRWSGEMGRRFIGLASLQEAARILPGQDIRNEAIACMSLLDLRPVEGWPLQNRRHANIAFDGRFERYAWVLEDGGLALSRVADSQEILRLPSLQRFVNDWYLDLSPDGRWLSLIYGLRGDQSVVVWDLEARAIRLEIPTSGEQFVDLAEGGRLFAYRAPDDSIRIHDLVTNEERTRIADHGLKTPTFFAFHPVRPLLAITTPTSEEVLIHDYDRGRHVSRFPLGGPGRYLVWSPDGSLLAVAVDREIAVLDYATGRRLSTLKGHQAQVCQLQFHPSRNVLFSNSWDNSQRVWDPMTGEKLLRGQGMRVDISADGDKMGIVDNFKATILDVAAGRERRVLRERIGKPGNHRDAQFDASGRLLLTSHDYGVSLWDLSFDSQLCELNLGETHEVAWLEGSSAFVTSGISGLQYWPIQLEDAPAILKVGPPTPVGVSPQHFVTKMAADRAGSTLFACRLDRGGAYVIDAQTRRGRDHLPGVVGDLAMSPDGRLMACSHWYSKGETTVWETATMKTLAVLPGDPSVMTSIDFSPDGTRLVASDFQRVRLFDTTTWSVIWEQERTPGVGSNYMAHISPDGHHLALLEQGVKVRLLELATGRELADLECDTDIVTDMNFNGNGSQLVVMGGGLSVHVWDLHELRRNLREIGLDWDAPPVPAPPDLDAARARGPLSIEIDYGDPDAHPARSPLRLAAHGIEREVVLSRLNEDPDDAEALAWRGLIQQREGLQQAALDDLSRALSIDPSLAIAYAARGRIFVARGDDTRAAADFEEALASGDHDPMIRNSLAWIYVAGPEELRDPDRAVVLAREAIEGAPEDPLIANTLGVALYRTGRDDEATRVLIENAGRPDNELPAYDWLFAAMSYQRLGMTDEAAAAWGKMCQSEATIFQQGQALQAEWKSLRLEAETILGEAASTPEAPESKPPGF